MAKRKTEAPPRPKANYEVVKYLMDLKVGIGRGKACQCSRTPGVTVDVCMAAVSEARQTNEKYWVANLIMALCDEDAVSSLAMEVKRQQQDRAREREARDRKESERLAEIAEALAWLQKYTDAEYATLHEATLNWLRAMTPGDTRRVQLQRIGTIPMRMNDEQALILHWANRDKK